MAPRILASRTLFVADDRQQALGYAEQGLRRAALRVPELQKLGPDAPLEQLIRTYDTHTGEVEDVLASLKADTVLPYATDWVFQVHSIDPPHAYILRSLELTATQVLPRLKQAFGI